MRIEERNTALFSLSLVRIMLDEKSQLSLSLSVWGIEFIRSEKNDDDETHHLVSVYWIKREEEEEEENKFSFLFPSLSHWCIDDLISSFSFSLSLTQLDWISSFPFLHFTRTNEKNSFSIYQRKWQDNFGYCTMQFKT